MERIEVDLDFTPVEVHYLPKSVLLLDSILDTPIAGVDYFMLGTRNGLVEDYTKYKLVVCPPTDSAGVFIVDIGGEVYTDCVWQPLDDNAFIAQFVVYNAYVPRIAGTDHPGALVPGIWDVIVEFNVPAENVSRGAFKYIGNIDFLGTLGEAGYFDALTLYRAGSLDVKPPKPPVLRNIAERPTYIGGWIKVEDSVDSNGDWTGTQTAGKYFLLRFNVPSGVGGFMDIGLNQGVLTSAKVE